MANEKKQHSLRTAFELVRKIKYSNGDVAQWGPSCFVESKNDASKQIWSDLDTLAKIHLDANDPVNMAFEAGDNPIASFTFNETNTISWHIEKRTKIVE